MGGTSLTLRTVSEYGIHLENVKRSADNTHFYNVFIIYSQDESSEMFIGEWAEARGIRDQLFLATKVSFFSLKHGWRPSYKRVERSFFFLSTLSTTRLVMNLSLKKYSTLGIVPNLCTSL